MGSGVYLLEFFSSALGRFLESSDSLACYGKATISPSLHYLNVGVRIFQRRLGPTLYILSGGSGSSLGVH